MSYISAHTRTLFALLLALLSATGCAMDDDLPAGDGEPIERDAQERPPDPAEERDRVPPAVDMNMNTTADMSQNTDMADVADMGLSDDGTPPTTDMEDPCGPPPCMLGETRCQSDQLSTCMRDTDGCPGWAPPQDCPMGGVCQNDLCPSAETCVDNDGDGRGTSCPMGPDCDDDDATIYDGAPSYAMASTMTAIN